MASDKKSYAERVSNWDDAKVLRFLERQSAEGLESLVTSYSPRADTEIQNQFLLAAHYMYDLKTVTDEFTSALSTVEIPLKPDVGALRRSVASFARQLFVMTYTCGKEINLLNKQMRDQTARQLETIRQNKELYSQIMTDPMTGQYSRRFFFTDLPDKIKIADKHDDPLSVIVYDVNNFKKANDTHGHEAGDLVLKEISKVARAVLPKAYVFARLGGDEFGIILPKSTEQQAYEAAEQLRLAVKNHNMIYTLVEEEVESDYKIEGITIALGVKQHEAGESADDLYRGADAAFYVAHKQGKDRTVKYSEFEQHFKRMPVDETPLARPKPIAVRPRSKDGK